MLDHVYWYRRNRIPKSWSLPARFDEMRRCKDHYFVTVIEDKETEKIIAASTLAVELKFIRNCTLVGQVSPYRVDDLKLWNSHRIFWNFLRWNFSREVSNDDAARKGAGDWWQRDSVDSSDRYFRSRIFSSFTTGRSPVPARTIGGCCCQQGLSRKESRQSVSETWNNYNDFPWSPHFSSLCFENLRLRSSKKLFQKLGSSSHDFRSRCDRARTAIDHSLRGIAHASNTLIDPKYP